MKFLTDAQAPRPFSDLLRVMGGQLGWEVHTVYEHYIQHERKDARVIGWAHANDKVLVTLDLFREESGAEVNRELRDRGGRVIVLHGGPQQSVERALGRFLFHKDSWYPFLMSGDGRVDITDLKQPCKMRRPDELFAYFRQEPHRDLFAPYLEGQDKARRRPLRPRQRRGPSSRWDGSRGAHIASRGSREAAVCWSHRHACPPRHIRPIIPSAQPRRRRSRRCPPAFP